MNLHDQKQIFHTSSYLTNRHDISCLPHPHQTDQRIAGELLSTTDNVLIEKSNFNIRVADTQGRKNQVSALINQMYSWRGYQLDASEPRYSPNQTTLQACREADTLGTLSLNIDSEGGLLADELYHKEVDSLRKHGGTVCELTGLAVSTRLGSNELLAALFHLLHIIGRCLHRATDAVIEVNPRHSLYYQRILGFRQIGERKICGRVNAPAVLLHVETDFVEEQISRYAGCRKPSEHSLYPYFFSRLETENLCRRILEMSHLFPVSHPTRN
jgi:hypothetical protein